MKTARSLIHAWLVLDFFGDARRRGGNSSTLTTTIFTQGFLALVFAALLYPETPPIAFAAANLCLASLLIAVSVLGDQDRVDRQRADALLLGTSPVGRATVVAARAGHSAFYVALLTIGMALPPGILLAFLQDEPWLVLGYVALACVCVGLATGALAVTLALLTRLFGAARAALLGGSLKAVLLGGGIALFALGLQNLRGTADDLPFGRSGAELLPPYHAARLLHEPGNELWRLAVLAGIGLGLAALALLLGRQEHGAATAVRRNGPLQRLLNALAGRGPGAGVAEFTAVSMWRSPGFRGRVLPLLGLPAGMIYLSLRGDGGDGDEAGNGFVFLCVMLHLPAIYLPFLVAFLPRADQDNTGWVFEHAPPIALEVIRDAAWRALVTHVLVPVHAIAATLLVLTSSAPLDTALAAVFAFTVAVVISRPMCAALETVPFSDDSGNEPGTSLGTLFPVALLLLGLGVLFGAFAGTGLRIGLTVAAIGLAVAMLRRRPVADASAAPAATPSASVPAAVGATNAPAGTEPEAGPDEAEPEPPGEDLLAGNALNRELRAVALLYVAVSVVPTLVGAAFA